MKNVYISNEIEEKLMKLMHTAFRRGNSNGGILPGAVHQLIHILVEHYKDNNEPITVSGLAEKMNVTNSAMSQSLDILERKNIVERLKSGDDKRVTNVILTKKGRSIVKRFAKQHNKHESFISELTCYLGENDSAELARLLGRITEFAENHKKGDK